MDLKGIGEYIRFDDDRELFNLIDPIFQTRPDLPLREYFVKKDEEMRIDLVFKNIYNLESDQIELYMEHIDVLCYLNNIDNPLNIKEDMRIVFPPIQEYDQFRISEDEIEDGGDIREKLVVPNKTTKKDKSREKFKEDGFSLPPTILDRPKPSVRIENGVFSVGGIE